MTCTCGPTTHRAGMPRKKHRRPDCPLFIGSLRQHLLRRPRTRVVRTLQITPAGYRALLLNTLDRMAEQGMGVR